MFAFPFTIAPGKGSIAPRRQRRTRRSSRPRSEVCSRRHLPRAGHGNGSYSSAPTKARRPGSLHQRLPDQSVLSGEYRGWPIEAAIGVLNEVSAAQDRVARALVMFSEGIGATTTIPEDAGNQPLDLGIPIYPIATNYKHRIRRVFLPRNYFRMHQFEALGKMTGGRAGEHAFIDAAALRKILENVKSDGLAQYVVGFAPASGNEAPKQHSLEIKLASRSAGALEGGKRRAVY